MKEPKAAREPASGRKAAARVPGAPAGPQPADALQRSPVLAAQGKRMAQLLEKGRRPLQRVRARPTEDQLRHLVGAYVSNVKGTCRNEAVEVYRALLNTVDGSGEIGIAVVEWAENYGTEDFDVGNHMATIVTWAEGQFVVDTTAGQFGADDIMVMPLAEWVAAITHMQTQPLSHLRHEVLPRMPQSNAMNNRANDMYMTLWQDMPKPAPREDAPPVEEHHPAQGGNGKGGRRRRKCFLTSACVDFHGLPDDCHELTVLRDFRDGWMAAQPEGPALIDEYYAIAPALVDAIDASPRRAVFYAQIFVGVQGCVQLIAHGRMRAALDAYVAMVRALQAALPGANDIQGEVHVP